MSSGLLPRDVSALLHTSYTAALSREPGARVSSIQLVARDGIAKGLVAVGGAQAHILAFDAQRGQPVSDWATGVQVGNGYFADWHQVVKRLHRGDIVGSFAGRYIDIGAGLALLYLVISSFVMYFDLRRRRRSAGRRGWFWR